MPKTPNKIGDNADIKKYAERIMALLNEKDTLAEDIKELVAEAKANGINTKALNDAIKYHRKGLDKDYALTVNDYLSKMGGEPVFVD